MNRKEKEKQMYALVASWQKGDLSKINFCKTQKINIHTFSYWVQKYTNSRGGQKEEKEEKQEPRKSEKFVAMDVLPSVDTKFGEVELCYPNGVRLRLSKRFSVEELASLIRIRC